MKENVGWADMRRVETIFSTAWSVSVTRSAAGREGLVGRGLRRERR